jgi:LPXTG-motif cell wall-anchored protein
VLTSKPLSWCFALAVGLLPLTAPGFAGTGSRFTVSQPTEIPGLTLRPGSYSIHVVDHLSERYVVRVDAPKGKLHSTFLALANPAVPPPAAPGEVLWKNAPGDKEYVRGWLFRGEPSVLEFVYPKADAVAIAKSNDAKVPAIDPVSEGRPPILKGLSKSDLEVVTLWLLSSTHVGPKDNAAGIQAERYPEVASAAHKPVIARLPQTGSALPWIGLLGALSLLCAFIVRIYGRSYVRQGKAGC